MSNIRVTIGGEGGARSLSRISGTRAAVGVNAFGLKNLRNITGAELAPILLYALEPAFEAAQMDWPVQTGASKDSMVTEVTEVGAKFARAVLAAGGLKLIQDPRNVSKKDYAPFIEFLGTATASSGIMASSVIRNDAVIKARLREGLRQLIASKVRG